MRQGKRSFDGGAERIFVKTIGGGPGRPAIDDCSNGNSQAMLGDILMDAVVRETRQRVGNPSTVSTMRRSSRSCRSSALAAVFLGDAFLALAGNFIG